MSVSLVINCFCYVLGWLILSKSLCYCSEAERTCLRLNKDQIIGKKLSVLPLKSLESIGPGACLRECQRVRDCLSVNYDRKHLTCELIGQKSIADSLISDGNFIHMDVPDIIDPKDKLCGDKTCNNYSTCIHTQSNRSVCIATECSEPLPTLKNGIVSRRTFSPISATYTCSPGYTGVGTTNTIHCRPGGKWSSLSYSCEAAVDGGWGMWSEWSSCTKSCGGGTKVRSRSCDNPIPSYGGVYCNGTSADSEPCNTNLCPKDGGWGGWSGWSTCSTYCGGGIKVRNRTCNNPIPRYGGTQCSGPSEEDTYCNTDSCPGK